MAGRLREHLSLEAIEMRWPNWSAMCRGLIRSRNRMDTSIWGRKSHMKKMSIRDRVPACSTATLVIAPPGSEFAVIENIFADCGWPMLATSSIQEGIRCIHENSPQLVICDERMEDGDWRAILDVTIKERYPPYLIVTSRLADDRLWAEVLNRGGYDLLAKPYEPSEVIRVVGTAWSHLARAALSPTTPVAVRVGSLAWTS